MPRLILLLFIVSCTISKLWCEDSTKVKPKVEIGGALRFNYNLSTWKPEQVKRGGDLGFDVFRINAKGTYKNLSLDGEMRFYSAVFGGPMLKQGWVQYDFSSKNNIQLGLIQVPFGNLRYNSYSWFFSVNYYVGLEDDHDMGLKYTHVDDNWEYALAFFKNAEEYSFGNLSDISSSRYAYDVSSIDVDGDGNLEYRNKEVNQINGQLNRKFTTGQVKHRLGMSGMFGGLLNLDTKNIGSHYAFDLHYMLKIKRFGFKAQFSNYKYNPKTPSGESSDVIAMAAYGAPYLVSAQGNTYTAGVSYKVPIKSELIDALEFYNDFGYLDKLNADFEATMMNVTGVLVSAGPLYVYTDFALGKNQPWLGGLWSTGLAGGDVSADWHMRFNVNVGYYF